ncbi:MAG: hypothetical protein LBB49_01170 [Gracilibacteraceae bacterium]|jgi:hypothetical protein|nr:hypothetical protein [Gracilibacteraceae bacterium]
MKKPKVLSAIILPAAILLSLLLTACDRTPAPPYPFVKAANKNTILVVDRIHKTQFSYNLETFEAVENMSPNYTIHAGDPQYPFHTIGPDLQTALRADFSIINVQDRQVAVELGLPTGETIYPLAFSDSYLFFIKTEAGSSIKTVVRYDAATATLTEYPHLEGLISFGAVGGDTLYYTVFSEIESYSLYQADCTDVNAQPQLVRDGLNRGEVYVQGETLYLSDKRYLYSDQKRFRQEALNYFIGDTCLLQYIETANGYNAVIIDTETGETVKQAANFLGFSTTGNEIIMYCQGAIERFPYK